MIRRLLIFVNVLIVLMVVAGVAAFMMYSSDIPRLPDDLRLLAATPATEVFARDGELMGTLGGREYVAIERISLNFQNAVVSAEDKRFRSHRGIDHIATTRALWLNATHGGHAPGGSTITQQLSKNLFFSFKRSWERKIVEAMATIAIEQRLSKDEILEAYCNLIYFGRFAYGVERASRTYFNKHAAQLSIEEAALLAGLPNAPTRFDPYNHLAAAKGRQREILGRMADKGFIKRASIDSLAALPLKFADPTTSSEHGSYAMDYALERARTEIGSDLVNYGGVHIYTTIDLRLQRLAEQTVASGVDLLELNLMPGKEGDEGKLEGGLVAMDVSTGRILAMVGGRDYDLSPFNRATSSYRPPGSAFKPIIYMTALEMLHIGPETIYEDKPVTFTYGGGQTWSPKNFEPEFRGPVPLREALAKSINTVAAQLINQVGPGNVVKTASRLGIRSYVEPHLSLALGAANVTMVDMTTAFATIAHEGVESDPLFLTRIEGRGGDLLAEYLNAGEQRFDSETVYELITMMEGVLDYGTGTVVRKRGFMGTAIGKTGTSSDFRDSWFVGATPVLSVAAWVGFDDNRQMFLSSGKGVTGAAGAAPIWADFMIQATAGEPSRDFPRPSVPTQALQKQNQDFLQNLPLKKTAGN
jgi:1A family penicillin-binding protein